MVNRFTAPKSGDDVEAIVPNGSIELKDSGRARGVEFICHFLLESGLKASDEIEDILRGEDIADLSRDDLKQCMGGGIRGMREF
jgi:hypothetical protein